jgi:hypothetical protein
MARGKPQRRQVQRSQEERNTGEQQQSTMAKHYCGKQTLVNNMVSPKLWLSGFVLVVALSVKFFSVNEFKELPPPEASPWDWHETEPDLKPMTVDFLKTDKIETFWAYVTPDVAQFYRKVPGSLQVREPSFPGQYAKFST